MGEVKQEPKQTKFEKVTDDKKSILDTMNDVTSIRDFGGMKELEGELLFEGINKLNIKKASMIAKGITDNYKRDSQKKAEDFGVDFEYKDLDYENLGEAGLDKMDLSIINEIFIYEEKYIEIISSICSITNKYIILAMPYYTGYKVDQTIAAVRKIKGGFRKKVYEELAFSEKEGMNKFKYEDWKWAFTPKSIIDIFVGHGFAPIPGIFKKQKLASNWDYLTVVLENKK